jgi:Carbohydrate esterase, sialic acid-specific acetylesterase
MKPFRKLLVLFILLQPAIHAYSQDPDFYIFLCLGQSNMEGNARIEPVDTAGVDKRFRVLEALNCPDLGREMGKWYTAVPPLCRCRTGLTPADYFGRTLVENLPANIRVGIINVSIGGCKIELFDKDHYGAYKTTVPDWMTRMINEYDGNPYERLLAMAKIAQRDGVIKGILLHQGESNTNDTLWPAKVKVVYNNLLQDLNLHAASVPLLAGELLNKDQNGKCASMNAIIAQLPEVIPTAHVISSLGCTGTADGLHFNAAGYREIGKRYAAMMLHILGYTIKAAN